MKSDTDGMRKKVNNLKKQVDEKIAEAKQVEERLNGQIAALKSEKTKLQGNLGNAEREKAALLQKLNSWASITKDFTETTDKQGQLLRNTLDELNTVKADQIRGQKEYNETRASLMEKMAIIETLETEKRRLLEEKTELQNRVDRFLQPTGRTSAAVVPVTATRAIARPAAPVVRDISLNGLVTVVDLRNSMAGISIGSADGVKEGMKFHVTRGDEFICDVLIIDVDTEEAVGILELVQQNPRVGDNVSTNL
jgi:hypothetical protein